jgi:hypothetical protein
MATAQTVLRHVYNACEPSRPASGQFYVDCSAARGSDALIQRIEQRLALSQSPSTYLFTGHIGSGKSSELVQLSRALSHPAPAPGLYRYFPVLVDASDYLDDYDVSITDILLAMVAELGDRLRKELELEIEGHFEKFLRKLVKIWDDWGISEVELSGSGTAKAGPANVSIGTRIKIQRLKKDPSAREKVREALEPRMSVLLDEINQLFMEADMRVRRHDVKPGEAGYQGILLIVDNLEKIRKLKGTGEGLASQRELFLERYTQLTGLQLHVIYTVPLRLVRSQAGPQLQQLYGVEPFVLPMIKVRERTGAASRYEAGLTCMREMLRRRLGKDHPLGDVFQKDALDFLLRYSGGNPRNLMTFIQHACTYASAVPIQLSHAHRAIQQAVRMYSTAIPDSHWRKLASLDLSADCKIPNGDEDFLAMLENLSVLEYINGGAEEDPFAPAEPWYAVNPIVAELQKFKEVKAAIAAERAAPPASP